jgi:hypothetical protein
MDLWTEYLNFLIESVKRHNQHLPTLVMAPTLSEFVYDTSFFCLFY